MLARSKTDESAMPEAFETRLTHACFPQPAELSSSVWRYLPLAKFISLLHSSQLYLSRLDLLNDPHEGAMPNALVEARNNLFQEMGRKEISGLSVEVNRKLRQACYVNCWAISPFESEALWRLYTAEGDGVSIQTTYRALIDVIEPDDGLYVGKISYIDYETQWFPHDNVFHHVMHKRRAFSHENEVRLVKMLHDHIAVYDPPGPAGITVPVNLDNLIHAIYISPYARPWYADTVAAVVEQFAPTLSQRIHWSRMSSAPLF